MKIILRYCYIFYCSVPECNGNVIHDEPEQQLLSGEQQWSGGGGDGVAS